jgi:hypothetical protein
MKQFIYDIQFTSYPYSLMDYILKDYNPKSDYVNIKKTMISYVKKWLVLFNKTHGYDLQFVKYLGDGIVTVAINKQDVKSLFKIIHSEKYREVNAYMLDIHAPWKKEIAYPKDRRYRRYKWHFEMAIAMLIGSKKMIKKSEKISVDVSQDLSIQYYD